MMILICYDGSPDARAAIEDAAQLFAGRPATVLTVWQPFLVTATRTTTGLGIVSSVPDAEEVDASSRKVAEETAEEGAKLAAELGLAAQPRISSLASTTARAILAEAEHLGAAAIVMGSRGRTGLKSLLLGSVSHEVIQHADRTVVVVPSPEVAKSRAREVKEIAAA
jgi:nucleotide-binding universal stress UspA family protein